MGRFSRLLLPMPLPGRLSLAPCQFVLSPSLWLTAYLSAVGVVHCAYCSTLFLHCQEDFFFRLVLSVDLSSRRELVTHRVRPVRCSEFFHPIHLALQMDSFRNVWGGVPCGVPSVPLTMPRLYHDVPTPSSTNLKSFGEKFCSHGIPYPRRVS